MSRWHLCARYQLCRPKRRTDQSLSGCASRERPICGCHIRAPGPWKQIILLAIDLRRAVDLISSLPNVDINRIAYVGHSLGALFGGILSGVDRRIKASVLMAGVGSFTDVALLNMPNLAAGQLEKYKSIMEPIEPLRYIKNAAPNALLFQFGLQDLFFPRQKFVKYCCPVVLADDPPA